MKTRLMAILMLASGALFAETHVSIGVNIGPRPYYGPAPVVVGAYRPACPGPGYVWIDRYYDAYRTWYPGYWAMPPYAGAYWVAPRFYGGHYYNGYWNGRGRSYYRNEDRHEYRERGHEDRERGHGRERWDDHGRGFRR